MTRFTDCLPLLLKHEGGFVDDPQDPGGATNLGVTLATLSNWLGHPATVDDVRALTPDAVAPIYEAHYWRAAACDRLPTGVDDMVFDAAVMSGVGRAIKFLQRAVGVDADGAVGDQTLTAVAAMPAADVVKAMSAGREAFFRGLPTFPHFGTGWLKRLNEVTAEALADA